MHDPEFMITKILGPLALLYPQAGYSPKQLGAMAEIWREDLERYPEDVLVEALALLRKREKHFPALATMFEYASAVESRRRVGQRGLEEPPIPADRPNRGRYLHGLLRQIWFGSPEQKAEARAIFDAEVRPAKVSGDMGQ